MTIHQNLIAGEWVGSDAIKNINPSNTGDVVGEYARASVEDTKAAIAAAKASHNTLNTLKLVLCFAKFNNL